MIYAGYEASRLAGAPVVAAYRATARALRALPPSIGRRKPVRQVWAACEVMSGARATHTRPAYAIDSVLVDGEPVAVTEHESPTSPFATMIHFRKDIETTQPRVLVVGPLSGHFTTLIRPTIRTLLSDHDVYVLDWHNARDVAAVHGEFGLDDYIEHVMNALRHLGPDTHVVAVCQPAVPVLAAVALLAARDEESQPRSMTLIAGPVDCRVAPNEMNVLAESKPLSYFEKHVIDTVPRRYAGAGRRVYPGFVPLAAFMSMNMQRHLQSHLEMYRDLVDGNEEKARSSKEFYDEYGAVLDVFAGFYLDTVDRIFQRHLLAVGELTWRGERVDPSLIRRTALLTIEGERDQLCSPGQTDAAHGLCTSLPDSKRGRLLAADVGHYGVFSGSRWEADIYPVLRGFISEHATASV